MMNAKGNVCSIMWRIFIDDELVKECYTENHAYKCIGLKKKDSWKLEKSNCKIVKYTKEFNDLQDYYEWNIENCLREII